MSRLLFESKLGAFNMRIRSVLLALVLLPGLASASLATQLQDAAQEGQTETQGSYEYQDRITVQRTVEDVMARPEFQRLREVDREDRASSSWLQDLLDWLEKLFTRDTDRAQTSVNFGAGLIYGIAFLIVVAALAFIAKSILESAAAKELAVSRDRARIVRSGAAPGETPPEEYWARAQELAAAGNEKLALRELLLGAMSALERSGFIRHRPGLTNRDYFWAAAGDARESLQTLIAAFERVYFGRRAVSAESYRECARAYLKSFPTGFGTNSHEAATGASA